MTKVIKKFIRWLFGYGNKEFVTVLDYRMGCPLVDGYQKNTNYLATRGWDFGYEGLDKVKCISITGSDKIYRVEYAYTDSKGKALIRVRPKIDIAANNAAVWVREAV